MPPRDSPLETSSRTSCRILPGSSSLMGSTTRALPVSQRPQGAQGQGGVHRQRHFRRPQRVPAEQRHEPGRAGGHHHPLRMVRILDPKRAQILVAAPQGPFDGTVAHLQPGDLRHPLLPAAIAGRQSRRRPGRTNGRGGRRRRRWARRSAGYSSCPCGGIFARDSLNASGATSAPSARTTTLFRTSSHLARIVKESPSGARVSSQRRVMRASFTSKRSAKSDSALSGIPHSAGSLGVVPDGDLLQDPCTHFPQPLHHQGAVRVPIRAGNPAANRARYGSLVLLPAARAAVR